MGTIVVVAVPVISSLSTKATEYYSSTTLDI